jgi:hypothetical protein
LLAAFGAIFLPLEAYEVLNNGDISMPLWVFLLVAIVPGFVVFLVDGFFIGGYLKREVVIPIPSSDTKLILKFGDLFEEQGWKAIGVNDFFDSIVDEDLVSSKSLHGYVLNTHWNGNRDDWQKQVAVSLRGKSPNKEARSKGNKLRYPVGTTARASANDLNFLFVALGETNLANNITSANAEMLIHAVRGMVAEARAACSMEPLVIPLMGSGLARVGIKNSVLVDLIVTAILEESRIGRVTGEIKIILPKDKTNHINLKNHVRNWSYGE